MLKHREDEARMMYELSKLTNTSKQITTDFLESALLFLFKEYIACHPKKSKFLTDFMNQWESSINQQKELEIESLVTQYKTMNDLAVGSFIANSENLDSYKKDVRTIKDILTLALISDIDE